jgi:hypothetical protein
VAATTGFYLHNVTLTGSSTFSGAGTLYMNGTTTITGDVTLTLPSELSSLLTGSGSVVLAAPMVWHGGTISLAGGLDVAVGQTLTLPGNGQTRVLQATSLQNFGTVAQFNSSTLLMQGGTVVSVRNETGALWTFDSGTFNLTINGVGTHSFLNAGTMQGTGVATTTLNVSNSIAFTNTGSIVAMTVVPVP